MRWVLRVCWRFKCLPSYIERIGPESLKGEPVPFDGPSAIGHYEDRFLKTDQSWKIQRRKLHFAFRRF